MKLTKTRLKKIIKEEIESAAHMQENLSVGLVSHLDNAYNVVYAIASELDEGPFLSVDDANAARESYMESLYKATHILDSLRERLEDLE